MGEKVKFMAMGDNRRYAPMPILEQEERLMTLAERWNWRFEVVGVAPIPEAPVPCRDRLLVPIEQDATQLPPEALRKIEAIYNQGIWPKALLLAHEAPQVLAPPKSTRILSPLEFWLRFLGMKSIQFGKGAARIVGPHSESCCFCLLRWGCCFSGRRLGWPFLY